MRAATLLVAALMAFAPAETLASTSHATSNSSHHGHHSRIKRDPEQRRAFMRQHPCPGGPDAGSTKRCHGYVVDHVKALKHGGADRPSNMQWQTVAEGKAKDRVE